MYKYFVLCLIVLCGCSKNAPISQEQDAPVQQPEQTVTLKDSEIPMTTGDISQEIEGNNVLNSILRDRYKWFAYYEYTEPDISGNGIRRIDHAYTLKTMDEILDKNYSSNIGPYSYDQYGVKAYHARDYFFKANEYRDKQDYENALKYYEIALSIYDWGAFYYHYGSLLIDLGDYENAKRAFNRAIDKIQWDHPYSMVAPYYPIWGRNNIYSFDSSGIARELYFSYYNLACMYSINNRLQDSEDNIILAIKNGYPYLDHILADPDLENLFNAPNADQIKDRINQAYSAGTVNTVGGKTFYYRPGPNDSVEYKFINGREMRKHFLSWDDRDRIYHGTYIVKNYHVIIYYNRTTGSKGIGGYSRGGNMVYDYYEPYDKSIDDFEYISLAYMEKKDGYGWEEK